MGLFFIRNFEVSGAAFGHRLSATVFGIEVVLAGFARENLAVLRDLEAFCV